MILVIYIIIISQFSVQKSLVLNPFEVLAQDIPFRPMPYPICSKLDDRGCSACRIRSGDLQCFDRARNDSKEGTKEFGEFDGEFDGEFSLLFSNSTQDHNGQETGDRRPDAARRWPM